MLPDSIALKARADSSFGSADVASEAEGPEGFESCSSVCSYVCVSSCTKVIQDPKRHADHKNIYIFMCVCL